MFFVGLTPPTDVSHDISNCLTGLQLVPDSHDFVVTNLKLCGTNFFLGQHFDNQLELLTFLNDTFNGIYGYTGVWHIVSNHLIYTGNEECLSDSCISFESCLLKEDGFYLLKEDGFKIIIE